MAPKLHELVVSLARGHVVLIVEEEAVKVLLEHLVEAVGLLLQILLEVLEEILLRTSLIQVVPVHVGPLEHAAATAHLSESIIQELELDNLEAVLVMQLLHLLLDVVLLPSRELHATVMVHETLKVEHVLLECVLGLLPRLLLFLVLSLLCLLVIDVALVVPPRRCAVRRPLAKAEPTELVSATTSLGADHVVAALVLLYRLVALWTLLRVGPDPTDVLRLRAVLDVPHIHQLAVGWAMCLLAAAPTPDEGAGAADVAHLSTLVFAGVRTTRRVGAPFNRGVVVDV
mmetsp:Transcript_56369/g.167728  ORF Transcript_56369/g.167728 Transcript_56369/m.167728 type:complete len:286 (+) Transcript_56369:319-1176(+)